MFLFNNAFADTIIVLRRGPRNWKGDLDPGNEFEESHKIHGVLVQRNGGETDAFLKDSVETSGFLFMPMGSDVKATDQVEIEATGERLVIYGKPFTYNTGVIRGTAVKFRGYTSAN